MKYALILSFGELSALEVLCALEDQGKNFRITELSDGYLIVDVDGVEIRGFSRLLGGFFKIAELVELKPHDVRGIVEHALGEVVIENKSAYGVSVYSPRPERLEEIYSAIADSVASVLKSLGVGRSRRISSKRAKLGSTYSLEIPSDDVAEKLLQTSGFELLALDSKNGLWMGRTLATVESEGFRFRDLERPFLRSEITMPPRIARVLVNLAGARSGDLVLDPFCGLGTILGEAAVRGCRVMGVDIDGKRVSEAKANLRWLEKKMGVADVSLVQGDARHLDRLLPESSVEAIATEPILLPQLKRLPSQASALRMLSEASETYYASLRSMSGVLKPGGRIAIVAPSVKTLDGRILSFPLEKGIRSLGLRAYAPSSLREIRYPLTVGSGDQRALRAVYVFEKA